MAKQNPARVSGVNEQNARSRAGGRPKYKPTDEQRSQVRELVAATPKLTQREIAAKIGVSPVTLRKAFAAELAEKVDQAGQLDFDSQQAPVAAESAVAAPGRPEFEPTWRMREDVKLCKADNWSDERICRLLGIGSRTTLVKHFAAELEHGADLLRIKVLRGLDLAASKGSPGAAEKLLRLAGMVAPLSPVAPSDDEAPPAPKLGKKEQANRDAHTAHVGTSWSEILSKKKTTSTMPN